MLVPRDVSSGRLSQVLFPSPEEATAAVASAMALLNTTSESVLWRHVGPDQSSRISEVIPQVIKTEWTVKNLDADLIMLQ